MKKKAKINIPKNIISIILCLYTLITVVLIGNTVLSSFKTKSDLIKNIWGLPSSFSIENYQLILVEDNFILYFLNSTLLVIISIILLLFLSSMVAYGLSCFNFKGRNILQSYFLIGLMFPIQLGILPLFVILNKLHLNNTVYGLALLYAANMSFPVFVFSNFFKGIPPSLSESARIDGASEFKIYRQIILPVSKPALFTTGLINFITIWNDFYMPLVFLTKSTTKTLTLAIYSYMSNFLSNWHIVFAGVTLALLPVIIVFFLFSNQIVDGLTVGAVKG